MNRLMKNCLLACALALVAQPVFAQEEKEYAGAPDPKSYGYTVLRVGIGTPLSLPWGFDWDVYGLDVNLLYSDANEMYGIQVGGLANVSRLDMLGIQAALGCNYANRHAYGAQVALVNVANREQVGLFVDAVGVNRESVGLRADVLGSLTDECFWGLSAAGLASAVREDMWGWQFALGCTFARRVHGFQSSLLFNMTDELRGAQLGIVNYAATCSAGFQVGLVNMIMDNEIPVLPLFNCYF